MSDPQYEYKKGEDDCANGSPPKSDDGFYLKGYSDQYAQEQQLTAQGENNEPR